MTKKTKKLLTLDSILNAYADQYVKLGDDEITVEKAAAMKKPLDGMLREHARALKIAKRSKFHGKK